MNEHRIDPKLAAVVQAGVRALGFEPVEMDRFLDVGDGTLVTCWRGIRSGVEGLLYVTCGSWGENVRATFKHYEPEPPPDPEVDAKFRRKYQAILKELGPGTHDLDEVARRLYPLPKDPR